MILDEITNSTEYPPSINAVYDLSQLSFDNKTTAFLRSLVKKAGDYPQRSGAKTIYVCPEDLQFGMVRMWEVFIREIPIETRVTRSRNAALNLINDQKTHFT